MVIFFFNHPHIEQVNVFKCLSYNIIPFEIGWTPNLKFKTLNATYSVAMSSTGQYQAAAPIGHNPEHHLCISNDFGNSKL